MYFNDANGADSIKYSIEIRGLSGIGATNDELTNLLMAGAKEQIHIFRTHKGEPISYLAYAKISKYSLNMLFAGEKKNLIFYEMDEGNILFILDVVIVKGRSRLALEYLREYLIKFRLIAFKRRGRVKIYYRVAGSFQRAMLETAKRETLKA